MCTQVRKGMALVDERLKPAATWEFDADIAILTHSTTIQPRYQVCTVCSQIAFDIASLVTGRSMPGDMQYLRQASMQWTRC
jgi:GTPase